MKGLIFSIKRYSINDGPGIRVTFFMKGCPLSCLWCHNPEGISPLQETMEVEERVGERQFIKKELVGEFYDPGDILNILEKDRMFIRESGGGVTFSGGEPLKQPEFLLEALKACKSEGYHTAVDTSGYSDPGKLIMIMPFTDLFLFDVKHLQNEQHEIITGVSNTIILENFRLILNSGKDMYIRIPVIPGFNDTPEYLQLLRSFLQENRRENIRKVCLLAYHRTGASKYRRLNLADRMNGIKAPTAERMKELKDYFASTGLKVKTGG